MPQEFQVLQCFGCQTFQVDIVKKVPKWTCKICGEKQSVIKVYKTGTGKECRVVVQFLNEQRLSKPADFHSMESSVSLANQASCDQRASYCSEDCGSKWAQFIPKEQQELSHDQNYPAADTTKLECHDPKGETSFETMDNIFEDQVDLEDILRL